jgi:hypothetical protein
VRLPCEGSQWGDEIMGIVEVSKGESMWFILAGSRPRGMNDIIT